jgi:RNA polymerase sigma factor (sigma-70 family)
MIVDALNEAWATIANWRAFAHELAFRLARRSRRAERIGNKPDDVLANRPDLHAMPPDEEAMARESLELDEAERKRLRSCVAQLRPIEKAVIEAYQTGKPYRDLAKDLGIPEPTFRYRLKRTLEKLATCMRGST